MRKVIYNFCLLFALTSVLAGSAAAQQKTGYVDTDYLVSQIPEYQSVQQQLRSLSQEWRAELDEMQQEIERLREDFSAREILYTDEIRNQKEQEINSKIQQRQQYLEQKFGAEGDFFQRQKELLEPIQRQVFEAITRVAEREGFDFVLDRTQKTELLYAREQWNLNDEVLLELGIAVDNPSN
ncbi:OmpH family outer membrane protein [Balneolaceae bacterium YR4-1]|uniref:OmpH family outer membrane protein n=1 Tax=Halalkalibaculum roseum TaxID=2709311 RepID=A0A6M1SQ37_9BACT|nr:OmpH family outer membrane protein [Halalkalibaculum roseum]NGP77219.1 OmpH family outer membrane protein [Halalkalibaculum roseum]